MTLGPQRKMRTGFWKVRTLKLEAGKLTKVMKEMEGYRLDILGISEVQGLILKR